MVDEKWADEVCSVIWRVSRDDLLRAGEILGDGAVEMTVEEMKRGQDFFTTPVGKMFFKNGRMKGGRK